MRRLFLVSTNTTSLTVSTPTSPIASTPCPHGLRPGTTVCLRCRQDARIAMRNRRLKVGARFGAMAVGAGLLVTFLVVGLTAIATDARSRSGAAAGETAPNPPAKVGKSARAKKPVAITSSSEAVIPRIAEGRKDLGDGV